jgi:hypothetical protein
MNGRTHILEELLAAEITHQHSVQAPEAALVYTDKDLTVPVSILHGQHKVHHKAVAATAAQAAREATMDRIHGAELAKVQIIYEAVRTAAAVADREQVGLLVQATVVEA